MLHVTPNTGVEDWDLMFRAALVRLRQAVEVPLTNTETVLDCADALDHLRTTALALLQYKP